MDDPVIGTALEFGSDITLERLLVMAPYTIMILMIVFFGVIVAWFLMRSHIVSLKEQIEYLKNRKIE